MAHSTSCIPEGSGAHLLLLEQLRNPIDTVLQSIGGLQGDTYSLETWKDTKKSLPPVTTFHVQQQQQQPHSTTNGFSAMFSTPAPVLTSNSTRRGSSSSTIDNRPQQQGMTTGGAPFTTHDVEIPHQQTANAAAAPVPLKAKIPNDQIHEEPFFEQSMFGLGHSAILEGRDPCRARPTSKLRQDALDDFKPHRKMNERTLQRVDESIHEFVDRKFVSTVRGEMCGGSGGSELNRLPPLAQGQQLSQVLDELHHRRGKQHCVVPTISGNLGTPAASEKDANNARSSKNREFMSRPTIFAYKTQGSLSMLLDRSTALGSTNSVELTSNSRLSGDGGSIPSTAGLQSRSSADGDMHVPLPLYHNIHYSEMLLEQKILFEERDIHNDVYQEALVRQTQHATYLRQAFESMLAGDFLKKHDGAANGVNLPEVRRDYMRLIRDPLPVMFVQHEDELSEDEKRRGMQPEDAE